MNLKSVTNTKSLPILLQYNCKITKCNIYGFLNSFSNVNHPDFILKVKHSKPLNILFNFSSGLNKFSLSLNLSSDL